MPAHFLGSVSGEQGEREEARSDEPRDGEGETETMNSLISDCQTSRGGGIRDRSCRGRDACDKAVFNSCEQCASKGRSQVSGGWYPLLLVRKEWGSSHGVTHGLESLRPKSRRAEESERAIVEEIDEREEGEVRSHRVKRKSWHISDVVDLLQPRSAQLPLLLLSDAKT